MVGNEAVEFESLTSEEMTQRKWGGLISGGGKRGFTIVPDVLLRMQGELEITSSEMVVLLNLIAYWWFSDKPPFPGNDALSSRTGLATRSVQRAISGLKEKGLIEIKVTRKALSNNSFLTRREVDFAPLRRRLEKSRDLEPATSL